MAVKRRKRRAALKRRFTQQTTRAYGGVSQLKQIWWHTPESSWGWVGGGEVDHAVLMSSQYILLHATYAMTSLAALMFYALRDLACFASDKIHTMAFCICHSTH